MSEAATAETNVSGGGGEGKGRRGMVWVGAETNTAHGASREEYPLEKEKKDKKRIGSIRE